MCTNWCEPAYQLLREKKSKLVVAEALTKGCLPIIHANVQQLLANKIQDATLIQDYVKFGIVIQDLCDVICLHFRNQTVYRKIVSSILIHELTAPNSSLQKILALLVHVCLLKLHNMTASSSGFPSASSRDHIWLSAQQMSSVEIYQLLSVVEMLYKHLTDDTNNFDYDIISFQRQRFIHTQINIELEREIASRFAQKHLFTNLPNNNYLFKQQETLFQEYEMSLQCTKTYNDDTLKNCNSMTETTVSKIQNFSNFETTVSNFETTVSKIQNFSNFELHVNLFSNSWNTITNFILAPELQHSCDRYTEWYRDVTSKTLADLKCCKKLIWTVEGYCDLELLTKHGPQYVRSTIIQTLILLCFNRRTVCTFQQLRDMCGLHGTRFENELLSLAHPHVKILCKKPPTPKLDPDHMFKLNDQFRCILANTSVPQLFVAPVYQVVEVNKVGSNSGFWNWRQNRLDTLLLSIMKQRGRSCITHKDLVYQCMSKMKSTIIPTCYLSNPEATHKNALHISPQAIKTRIEHAIEQEYIQRDPNDRQLYYYCP